MTLSLEEGALLVKYARHVMNTFLTEGREADPPTDFPPKLFDLKNGIFLTLRRHPSADIRGYIGFPYPEQPLPLTIVRAAVGTVVGDMRFRPVNIEEMDNLIIRITITSEPEVLRWVEPKDLVKKIVVGRDGLIAKVGRHTGRLLPQVAVERGWNEEAFLGNLCIHAGLAADAWMQEREIEISRFTAQIFEEEAPGGQIKEVKLPVHE